MRLEEVFTGALGRTALGHPRSAIVSTGRVTLTWTLAKYPKPGDHPFTLRSALMGVHRSRVTVPPPRPDVGPGGATFNVVQEVVIHNDGPGWEARQP